MGELRRDDDKPRCPFCKYPSDKTDLDGRYETITCRSCGRNFYARIVKVYETTSITI